MRRVAVLLLFCAAAAVASSAQLFTKLADFDGTNGANPIASLILAKDGNFYGTTSNGGANTDGTVFKIAPEGALTPLYSFCPKLGCADGSSPAAGLVQAIDGNFYGTTSRGGTSSNCYGGCGTVFKITPEGVLTTLHSFEGTDGDIPYADLVQATDGNFYGTTSGGGDNSWGTVFKITPEGTLTTLYSFCPQIPCPDGEVPIAGLVQATDGNFYGTTEFGGVYYSGTVFKITPEGTLTTLHSFDFAEGYAPSADLVQGTNGSFYGTTFEGGSYSIGTVFRITPQGVLTTLHDFQYQDGDQPTARLTQATDGNLYGTTREGGASDNCQDRCGTLFKITPEGALTRLYSFAGTGDGYYPQGGLAQGTDGKFYGTTSMGGSNDDGTVFRMDSGFFAALSLTKDGSGTVASGDRHIYCGSVCIYPYPRGTQVTLSAVPAPGYTFTGWTGCDNMNGSYCSVTMSSAKDVIATFTSASVMLSSLTFKPSYVKGGQLSAGTLTLSGPAPEGGVTVALSSDHPGVAHPPSFVFVPGGKNSVQFAVNTFPVKSNTTVMITATAGSSQVSGTLTVGTTSLPPSLR